MEPSDPNNSPMEIDQEDFPRPPTQVRMQFQGMRPQVRSQARPQSSLPFAPIIFYLQTHDQSDDVLFIKRKDNGGYRATFHNRTVQRGFIQDLTGYSELIQYLESFMMLQVMDREACDFIQIDVPGLPAIIIKPHVREWDDVFPHIRRHLRTMCESSISRPKQFNIPKIK